MAEVPTIWSWRRVRSGLTTILGGARQPRARRPRGGYPGPAKEDVKVPRGPLPGEPSVPWEPDSK